MIPNELIIQVLSYAVVMGLVLFILSFLLRGFFWKFLRVKGSMGRLVLVKIRSINVDRYVIGRIEEQFLCFKLDKEDKRIAIIDRSVFYRCIGVNWVDVDEVRNCLVKPDFSTSPGFDAVLYNNLYLRALYKPAITNNFEKVALLISIISIVLLIVCIILLVKEQGSIVTLQNHVLYLASKINTSQAVSQGIQLATI